MLKIKISNNCIVTDCPQSIIEVAKKALSIKNKIFEKVCRISGSRFAAQEYFRYYTIPKESVGEVIVPRGFSSRFTSYLDKMNIKYEITEDLLSPLLSSPLVFTGKLRDYQEKIITDTIKHNCGVINSSVGSGKTIMALETIRRLGLKATILVPNSVIQDQFIEEARKNFNYNVGIINGKAKDINEVTVSTFQSLFNNEELLRELSNNTGTLIIDEIHMVPAKGRMKILSQFKPKYLYGYSGSPRRSADDSRTEAIFFLCGPVIATYESESMQPTVESIYSSVDIPCLDYPTIIESMVENENRNRLIMGLVVGEVMAGRKVLILCKRIRHYELVRELMPIGWKGVHYIESSDKDRNAKLMAMRAGEVPFNAIFGTMSLLATGTDIPALDTLIMAADLKSDVLLQQSVGRIQRIFSGKPTPKIIDIVDNKNAILLRQWWDRKRFYQSRKWIIS